LRANLLGEVTEQEFADSRAHETQQSQRDCPVLLERAHDEQVQHACDCTAEDEHVRGCALHFRPQVQQVEHHGANQQATADT